ncbi:MAG: phosphoribosylglycinamide formyltransferase [Caulobacteraceae bacterium]|nr:phosphoribosylglycinamide formyltransferase [Caulobacteraceae bacterium]
MTRVGFLASGGGSSMIAIVDAARVGRLAIAPALLVVNKAGAPALEAARARGVPTEVIPTARDPEAADAKLLAAMTGAGVEWIVLSGYLRLLGPRLLAGYEGRILNIHPGPLPAFGGAGMYGARVHEAVIAAAAPASEICVHLVDAEYDHGAVIARRPVEIRPGDTAAALEARVRALEPEFFVQALQTLLPQA